MSGWMWIRAFDLDEAFGADCLIATSRLVNVRRIVEVADRTFSDIFV